MHNNEQEYVICKYTYFIISLGHNDSQSVHFHYIYRYDINLYYIINGIINIVISQNELH